MLTSDENGSKALKASEKLILDLNQIGFKMKTVKEKYIKQQKYIISSPNQKSNPIFVWRLYETYLAGGCFKMTTFFNM